MKVYRLSDMDLFFKSPYSILKLTNRGIYIYHTLNDNSLEIVCSKKDAASLWKLLENGGSRENYEEILSHNNNEIIFLQILRLGLME